MATKIRPLHDRVIVKRIEEEEKTKGGIIIPDTAKEKPQEGKVVAVGPGKYEDGKLMPLGVKIGGQDSLREILRYGNQTGRRGASDYARR